MTKSPDGPVVTVVIVHFNAPEDLQACIEAIEASIGARPMLVVVDNSTDNSAREHGQRLSHRSGGHWLPMSGNQGFSAGVNAGVSTSETPFTFVINQDAVVQPDTIATLVDALGSEAAAIAAAPVVVTPDQRVWFAGGRFDASLGRIQLDSFGSLDMPTGIYSTNFISGCAFLVRTEDFRHIGGLDERFFLYWEDVEFSERARAMGHKLIVVATTLAVHRRGQAGDPMRNLSPPMLEHTLRSRRIFASSRPRREQLTLLATQPFEAFRLFVHSAVAEPRSVTTSARALLRGLVAPTRHREASHRRRRK